MTDDFMALTLDVWSMPTESARRVGHPAPFPVELPEQLIRLYTYAGDLVLDPFMGSGSTLVAAATLGRRYVGYDLDPSYVDIARRRVASALDALPDPSDTGLRGTVSRDGKALRHVVREALDAAGFEVVEADHRVAKAGVTVSFLARDAEGDAWFFDVAGAFTSHRGGLIRTDVAWRSLGRASAVRGRAPTFRSCSSRRICRADRARPTPRYAPPGPTRSSTPSACCRTTDASGWRITPRAASRTTRSRASGRRRSWSGGPLA